MRKLKLLPATTAIAVAVLMLSVPFASADELPTRRPGLWQLTTVAETVGMKTFETCIAGTDPLITGVGDPNCQMAPVKRLGDERYVDVVCRTSEGKETTSTVLTGDFTNWYRAVSKITFDPPQNGISHMGVTIDGTFRDADCRSERSPNKK